MSYIKFEARHLGEDRWLDATPAAFAVHVWALSFCDEQDTDGRIPVRRAHRLVCPVDPTAIPAAFAVLVDLGLWRLDGDHYVYDEYLAHGIAAEEKERTRSKWSEDKRRQRLCRLGNHQLCGPRSKCKKGSLPPQESATDSTSGQVDDQTRPDQTPKGVGDGGGSLAASEAARCPDCGLTSGRHVVDCQVLEAAS